MYIVNGFLRTLLYIGRGFRTIFQAMISGTSSSEESLPILQNQQSLTSDFEDYEHSLQTVRTCLKHVLLYYTVAVVAFTFFLEPDWSVIDSLYFATVLVSLSTRIKIPYIRFDSNSRMLHVLFSKLQFTTVGYGDLSPTTTGGFVLTIILCLYGITILGT